MVGRPRGRAAGPAGPDDPEGPEAACFPGEKAANGIDAGYDAVLLVNHHRGEAGGVFCGSGDFPPDRPIVTVCSSHEVLHHLFGYAPTTGIPYNPANEPDRGEVGEYIEASARFDGWGYTHLIRNTAGKMPTLDSYAIPEALNPEYAFGFGDLSVHEFATDPTEYVAYSSYYAGGMRVFTFGDDQEDPNKGHLEEQGVFIDDEGSNFWGVEQFTLGNQRYFAGSDRDYGLQIFRYTGPGAAQKPVCTNSMTMVPYRSTARVALPCSDANNNPLTESVVTGPTAGTLSGDASSGAVTYTHTASNLNGDRFTFKANDGTMDSEPATAQIVNTARDGGRCFNPFTGTAARESMTGSPFGDLIRGGGGNDVIEGQGGDDCLLGQGGRDQIDGDTGNDRLEGGSRKDRLFGGSGRDNHLGGGGNDHVRGGSGHDRARGGSGVDLLDGGSNNDRLRGGKGNDRLRGGPGRDRLFGDSGRDRLEAGDARRNRLSGGGGNDRLLAVNGKRDTVRCGKGRDRVQADRRDNVARDCEVVRRARLRN
jgi:hypothetical protein